jgi:hypothetical protein
MSNITNEKYEWRLRSHEIAETAQPDFTFRVRPDSMAEYEPIGSLVEAVRYLHENKAGEILVDFDFMTGEGRESDSLHFMNDLDPHLEDEEKKEYIARQIRVKIADTVFHQKYPF